MNEQQIKRLVSQEIDKRLSASRFNVGPVQRHTHNGVDSPIINFSDVGKSGCVMGLVTFASAKTYILKLNNTFTPSRIDVHGNVVDSASSPTIRALVHGIAILDPSFAFQPESTSSVVTGSVQYPLPTSEFPTGNVPAQSSSYLSVQNGGTFHVLSGDVGHIANVEYPVGTIHARGTVVSFSKSAIYFTVSNLDSGWVMNLNFTIT